VKSWLCRRSAGAPHAVRLCRWPRLFRDRCWPGEDGAPAPRAAGPPEAAYLMDQGGMSARTIADQLGHSRISMTQDVYLGGRAIDESASAALEDWDEGSDDDPPTLFTDAG
jgi:integrase